MAISPLTKELLSNSSKSFQVLLGLKKSPHDLAIHQEKVFEIDDHMGIVISGMTADARFLRKFMMNACINYEFVYGSKHPTERLIAAIAKKSQVKTAHPSKRPFGVGLLVGSIDAAGTHLFETCPSGNYYEYYSMAIGDRCQSAKTYLEKNFESFSGVSRDQLIAHGVQALKASAQDTDLTEHNCSIGVLGKGEPFRLLNKDEVKALVAAAGGEEEKMQID